MLKHKSVCFGAVSLPVVICDVNLRSFNNFSKLTELGFMRTMGICPNLWD